MHQREIGSFEAKTHFSQLLSEVASSHEITITRHGKRIATLSPCEKTVDEVNLVEEAIRTIQRLSAEIKLNHPSQEKLSIKEMIEEGRR